MSVTIVDVQKKTGTGTTAVFPAFAANPSNGDTIVVAFARSTSGAHGAPTDSQGNTYTQIGTLQNAAPTDPYVSVWMAVNITGGSSFVVTGHQGGTDYAAVSQRYYSAKDAVIALCDEEAKP